MVAKALEESLPIADKAIRRAKSLYFRPEDAREVVRESDEHGLAIIGIEGLTIVGQGIQPHLDLIADFVSVDQDWSHVTWDVFRERCNKGALKFLDIAETVHKPGDLVFDFSLMPEREFSGFQTRHEQRRQPRKRAS